MSEMKQITYSKPNMANLRGRLGKSIIETIMNTPKPDETKLREEAHEIEKLMIAAETVSNSRFEDEVDKLFDDYNEAFGILAK